MAMRELTLIAGMLLAGCGGGTEVTGDGTTDAGTGGLLEETGGAAAGLEETETGGVEETGGASTGGMVPGGSETGGTTETGGLATGGMETCPVGSERCPCYGNDTCDDGLTCFSELCVDAGTGGAGTGGVEEIGGAAPTGGVAAETGGFATGGAPVACTWETATVLPSSDEYAQIPANSCLRVGPSDDGGRILLIAISSVDFDFIPFEYSYLEGEEDCGPDYHAGLYLAQPLEMPGCTALIDMQGDPDLIIGFRWYH